MAGGGRLIGNGGVAQRMEGGGPRRMAQPRPLIRIGAVQPGEIGNGALHAACAGERSVRCPDNADSRSANRRVNTSTPASAANAARTRCSPPVSRLAQSEINRPPPAAMFCGRLAPLLAQ